LLFLDLVPAKVSYIRIGWHQVFLIIQVREKYRDDKSRPSAWGIAGEPTQAFSKKSDPRSHPKRCQKEALFCIQKRATADCAS
jgi:hypothetical protein